MVLEINNEGKMCIRDRLDSARANIATTSSCSFIILKYCIKNNLKKYAELECLLY